MLDLIVLAVLIGIVVALAKGARRRRAGRRADAATVELVIDRDGVRRTLADGRVEGARWARVASVEVVCTPVRTADGATSFALVAEAPSSTHDAAGDPVGCLVPLGVGHDGELLEELSRLPRFRTERFVDATEHRPPRRTIVWERHAGGGTGGGTASSP